MPEARAEEPPVGNEMPRPKTLGTRTVRTTTAKRIRSHRRLENRRRGPGSNHLVGRRPQRNGGRRRLRAAIIGHNAGIGSRRVKVKAMIVTSQGKSKYWTLLRRIASQAMIVTSQEKNPPDVTLVQSKVTRKILIKLIVRIWLKLIPMLKLKKQYRTIRKQ
uniref:Uncharacterized protein n=1 Tax=Cacopsylla melanoneura TaxID=428564 RepID=A0A8D8WMP8_9HEMI